MSLRGPARRQVAVSYAILAAALSGVMLAALAMPVRERTAFFADLDAQRATYEKSLEALARSKAVTRQFELRQAATDLTSRVFHAATPALAGADLQNQINALLAAAGATLLSSAFRESTGAGPLTTITVAVRLRCSTDALLKILHGIENRAPILFVESLTVQPRPNAARPQTDSNQLDVELDVLGFLATQAAP